MRLVGYYWALDPEHIDNESLFRCFWNIIKKFDLFISPDSDGGFFINREHGIDSYGFKDIWEEWIWRAKSRIRLSEVKKFPRYPRSARFRNSFGA